MRSNQPNMHPVLVPNAVCYVSGPDPKLIISKTLQPEGLSTKVDPLPLSTSLPPAIWEVIFRTRFLEIESFDFFYILTRVYIGIVDGFKGGYDPKVDKLIFYILKPLVF